nr:response regulator [Bradyrhizobium sp. Ai1a-2]
MTSSPSEILLVDNDESLEQQLSRFLSSRDCRVQAVRFSDDLPVLVERSHSSLILLDIESSRKDGFDNLRRIRAISDVPILVTSRRLTAFDRVIALELGADVCIDKPFDVHEFWAQARAIERRQKLGRYQVYRPRERGTYKFDGWTLRLLDRRLIDPTGRSSSLSRSTYALLLAFLDAPRTPLSRGFLLRAVQAREDVFDRSIDAQVLRLRRLFQRGAAAKSLIRTARGVGYLFDAVVERLH